MFNLLFEKLFFKKRVIFSKEKKELTKFEITRKSNEYRFMVEVQHKDLKRINYKGENIEKLFAKDKPYDIKFFCIVNERDELAGYYRAVIPQKEAVFYDSICLNPGEALLCNAYVFEKHRRKGLYSLMIDNCHIYLLKQTGIDRVYTIVEKSNVGSFRANIREGFKKASNNYLFKLIGVNIVSMIIDQDGERKVYCPLWQNLMQ